MRTRRRLLVAVLASVAALLLVPITATPTAADPIGNCTTTSGTIIAVDFGHWGGPIVRGCGVNQPNGYALLHAAGFSTAGDNHDGPGYICRIGNQAFGAGTQYPTPAQDPCIVTPPSTAYWSYWYATSGRNTWSYSNVGALGGHPQPGEVDLWVFGGTDVGGTNGSAVPHSNPDSMRAHNATPTGGPQPGGTPTTRGRVPTAPTATTPTAGASIAPRSNPYGSTVTTVDAGGSVSSAATGRARPGTPTNRSSSAPNPSASTVPVARASASSTAAPRFVDALPAVHTSGSTGSIVPVLIGAGLVLVLAGGTAGALRRRRQHE
ncbi:MAG: hypothetical protein QOI08_2766 [Actinomycetota bacterium]|nr:hypothetical protein [Actinomycetota bacterium]